MMPRGLWEDPVLAACGGLAGCAGVASKPSLRPQPSVELCPFWACTHHALRMLSGRLAMPSSAQ